MNNRILTPLLVLIITACLCTSAVSLATGGVLFFAGRSANSPLPPEATTAQPTSHVLPTLNPDSTATAAPEASPSLETAQPELSADIPEDIAAQMDEIQGQVEHLRGLTQREPVARALLSTDQLRERIKEKFLIENDEQTIADDLQVLSAFGLIEPDFDLYHFYLDLYTEQVAGFYDDETKEMVVIQGEEFDGPERVTYSHEFTHRLQDQQYGLRDGLGIDEEKCQADSEYCAAVQALIEGDASLTEQYWLYTYGSETDKQQIDDFYQSLRSPILDSAPQFIREDLGFPYTAGGEFVLYLFEQGGFAEIDAAYANPPVSTEQILHPGHYPFDQPAEVFMPDFSAVLGKELREIDRGVVGEWYTYLLLAKGRKQSIRLSEAQAKLASAGWGGDAYAVYLDDASGQLFLGAAWVWDSADNGRDFFDAFQDYGGLRWGTPAAASTATMLLWEDTPDGTVILQGDGGGTSWVIAPDGETANRLLQSLGEGEHAGVN